ncbi:MAG: metallophosphoesterase [Bacteroidota bacterium]
MLMTITPWFFVVLFLILGLWVVFELHFLRLGLKRLLPDRRSRPRIVKTILIVLASWMGFCTLVLITWAIYRGNRQWDFFYTLVMPTYGILHAVLTVFAGFVLLQLALEKLRSALAGLSSAKKTDQTAAADNGRRDFLVKTGALLSLAPVGAGGYSVLVGRDDFQLREVTIRSRRLPEAFDGFRIVQFSDVHIGSFQNLDEVQKGVSLIQSAEPDLLVFTGDWVNTQPREMAGFEQLFSDFQAPYGKYACLGNHDYGIYLPVLSPVDSETNFRNIKALIARMGYELLQNANTRIRKDGAEIALLGVDYYGHKGIYPPDLDLAAEGLAQDTFKVLLSHNPAHWRAEALAHPANIDLTLAGHTHGMQFGIDTKTLRWSPVQALYSEWADLYREREQYLYVNRGFGYVFFPGRFGVLPEITVLTLRRG